MNGQAGPGQTRIGFETAATEEKRIKAMALKGECQGGA
jgi:hypothetical protein